MLSAVAFLTVVGRRRESTAPNRWTMAYFPLVGAGIGGFLAGVWVAASEVWSAPVAAALVVCADLAITGLLHFDGLADSADGLLPHMDRDRRLAVMREPDVGAFALAVVPAVLVLRWVALATDAVDPLALIAIWSMSRTGMSVAAASVPYARAQGLASAFLGGAHRWHAACFGPALVGLFVIVGGLGLGAGAAGLAVGAGVVALGRARLGGFTGDVLGAAAVVAETAALLTLAVR